VEVTGLIPQRIAQALPVIGSPAQEWKGTWWEANLGLPGRTEDRLSSPVRSKQAPMVTLAANSRISISDFLD